MMSDTAASTAEPARPTLDSQASRRRRAICSSGGMGSMCALAAVAMVLFLLQIAPEDLILRVLDVVEIIALHREDEDTHRAQPHYDAGGHRQPGQFHRGMIG